MAKQYTFKKRVGPTSYNSVKNLIYYNNYNPFEVNFSSGGNCTWYAWGRFWEVWASVKTTYKNKMPTPPVSRSNACHFYEDARVNGYKVGLKPKPGAIICWGYNGKSLGEPGHVAFVEAVNMKNGSVESIEISHSGWSSGPMRNEILKPGDGKRGTNAYHRGYCNDYFNGFIYNPVNFGNPAGAVASTGEENTEATNVGGVAPSDTTASTTIDMKQRVSKLYSSSNYRYVEIENKGESEEQTYLKSVRDSIKKYLLNNKFSPTELSSAAIPESIVGSGPESFTKKEIVRSVSQFSLSKALVQAPFVELTIGGYTVGSYRGNLDEYPNYISRLDVKKINGEINQYTIGMVYQIRPGEDPNLLDKLFSKVRYNKIQIKYGDSESGTTFKDSEAIITNIVNERDYSSSRISYTIYATSTCNYITKVKFNFKSTTDKPSNVIRELLYGSSEVSRLLKEALPGMSNRLSVESKNLIPNNDAILNIEAKTNMDAISYINYLVGCMSNGVNAVEDIVRSSMYFITYEDSDKGPYFKISEVDNKTNKDSVLTNSVFNVTVGYPDGNDVYDFKINTNTAWSLLYENASKTKEYVYTINNRGENTLNYSPSLNGSTNVMNEIQKNWWTQMTSYPITATLVIRGLLKPIKLMDYVQIDVMFYGYKHITSGLYVVTGEQDILSGSGFMTNLSLMRVGD